MKISEVTYSRGATINTGNFNSARVDISASARIDDDPDGAFDRLKEWVDRRVAAEVSKHAK